MYANSIKTTAYRPSQGIRTELNNIRRLLY